MLNRRAPARDWTCRISLPNGALVTRSSAPRTNLAALLLLLGALLARAVIPAGWMVAPASAGVPIVICTGDGMVTGAMPGKNDGQPRTNSEPCAFAGLGLAALPAPLVAAVAAPLAVAIAILAPAVVLVPGRGLAAPPPPATGPPATA